MASNKDSIRAPSPPRPGELPEPRFIMVGYTDKQETLINDICEEDMVRPDNHKWCVQGGEETASWKLKSTAMCPIYGSCELCYRSGPVRKRFVKHKDMW